MGVTEQVETGCHLCWAWGHLSKSYKAHRLAAACLGFLDLLRDLGEIRDEGDNLYGGASGRDFSQVCKLGGAGSSEVSMAGH